MPFWWGTPRRRGTAREGRSSFSSKEEGNTVARSFHETVLLGMLCQAVHQATDREKGGCLLPGDK